MAKIRAGVSMRFLKRERMDRLDMAWARVSMVAYSEASALSASRPANFLRASPTKELLG